MATLQFGTIVTDAKGKIGGQVFQGGFNCKVLRNSSYNTGTRSPRRQGSTGNLSYVAGFWKSLSNIERAEWEAITDVWTFTDRFGNVYEGTGYQVFCSYNKALVDMGLYMVGEPAPPVVAPGFSLTSVQVDGPGNIRVTWSMEAGSNSIVSIYMTRALTPGLNSRNLRFRKIVQFDDSGTSPFNSLSTYQPVWGQPLLGSTIYWRLLVRNAVYPRLNLILEGSLVTGPFV
jgi:hypothetical protein